MAPGSPPPGLLPLLFAVPLGVILVRWHRHRVAAALDGHDGRAARGIAAVTLGALVPPLVTGVAFGAAGYHLPYGLSAHPGARVLVLGLAAGVLFGGLLAVTELLAAYDRRLTAALVAAVPLAGAGWQLPGTVAALALAYVLGLVTAAHAAFDTPPPPMIKASL